MPVIINESTLPKEFVCLVCQHAWDPEHCLACPSCEEVYCAQCVEDVAAKGGKCLGTGCTGLFDREAFTAVHRTVRSLADAQVPVKCTNFVYGCDWTGTRSAAGAHEAGCAKKKPQAHLYVGDVPEDLVCPICHEAFVEPALVEGCEHIACGACLTRALSSAPNKCPVCAASPAVVGRVPKQIRAAVDHLPVRCLYAEKGCAFVGPRLEYTAHVRKCGGAGEPPAAVPAAVPAPAPAAAAATAPPPSKTADPECTVRILHDIPSLQEGQSAAQDLTTMIHVEAPHLESLEERRQGITVSAVIDVSGSMSGAKLELVREALGFMIGQLSPKDSFGIITFATEVAEPFPMQCMTAGAKQQSEAIIQRIQATSCTNLSGGLFAGINQACGLAFNATGAPDEQPRRKALPKANNSASSRRNSSGSLLGAVASFFSSAPKHVDATLRPADVAPRGAEKDASPAQKDGTGKEAPTAVLLFTDGMANEGITDRSALFAALKDRLGLAEHVVVHTFGFGTDHDAILLQGIAEQSQGSYYFIKDKTVLKESFADCLGGLVSVVCTNLKVQMTLLNPQACEVSQVMTKYPMTQAGATRTISIKDMYSGESRDIPVSLRVTTRDHKAGASVPLLAWVVSYHSTIDEQEHESLHESIVAVAAEKYTGKADITVDEQRNRFVAAEAIQAARAAAESRDYTSAQDKLRRCKEAIACTSSAQTAYTVCLQDEMMELEGAVASESVYQGAGGRGLNHAMNRHTQQRCNVASAAPSAMYQTSWKADMKRKSGS